MAASEIYGLLCILNFQRLEVNGIMCTHTAGSRLKVKGTGERVQGAGAAKPHTLYFLPFTLRRSVQGVCTTLSSRA